MRMIVIILQSLLALLNVARNEIGRLRTWLRVFPC